MQRLGHDQAPFDPKADPDSLASRTMVVSFINVVMMVLLTALYAVSLSVADWKYQWLLAWRVSLPFVIFAFIGTLISTWCYKSDLKGTRFKSAHGPTQPQQLQWLQLLL
jgi:hypothetical protein